MKVLGIDYGKARIGIAVSDELGHIAFPRDIIKAKTTVLAIGEIMKTIEKDKIKMIAIGLPGGAMNTPIQKEIMAFAKKLGTVSGIPVVNVEEAMTSHEAFRGSHDLHQEKGRKIKIDRSPKDDIAAALILQRYLDKHHS